MTKMRDTYAEQFSKQSRLHGEFASQLEHLREDVKPLLKSVQSTLSIMPNTDRICTLGDVISVDEQNRHFELYRFAQQGRQEYQDFLSKHPELG